MDREDVSVLRERLEERGRGWGETHNLEKSIFYFFHKLRKEWVCSQLHVYNKDVQSNMITHRMWQAKSEVHDYISILSTSNIPLH
jgi:hypothetical protein